MDSPKRPKRGTIRQAREPLRVARDALVDANVDEVFRDATGPYRWALQLNLPVTGSGSRTLTGTGWRLVLDERGTDEESRPLTSAMLEVQTQTTDFGIARTIGRGRIRVVLGQLLVSSDLLSGWQHVSEKAVQPIANGMVRDIDARQRTEVHGEPHHFDELAIALADFDPDALAPRLQRALQWTAEAAWAQSLPAQLTNLWFAVVAVVDGTFSRTKVRNSEQMDRIHEYLMGKPLSQSSRDDLESDLRLAYGMRNDVVHDGRWEAVTPADVEKLWNRAREILRLEIGRAVH